jgi:amino-acid N-acetyltransferase
MDYSFATVAYEPEIKQLLMECDLLHEDITGDHLQHFLVGRAGSELAAVVGLEIKGRSALLRSLAVAEKYRNRRIATKLVREIEEHARSLNVDTLYLLTMTAEAFFAKCGYQGTEREAAPAGIQTTAEFQSLCPASAVCMVKYLGPSHSKSNSLQCSSHV